MDSVKPPTGWLTASLNVNINLVGSAVVTLIDNNDASLDGVVLVQENVDEAVLPTPADVYALASTSIVQEPLPSGVNVAVYVVPLLRNLK